MDLFGAGSETTSTTLTFAIFFLAKYPEASLKLSLYPGESGNVNVSFVSTLTGPNEIVQRVDEGSLQGGSSIQQGT